MTMDSSKFIEILDDNGIDYTESGSDVLTYCPSCSHHKKKLSINPEKGTGACFVCGFSGTTNKLLAALGVVDFEEYDEDGVEVGRNYPVIESYLASRGFKEGGEYLNLSKFIDKLRIDFKPSQELLSSKGKPFKLNNVITVPYRGLKEDGYTSVGYKHRSLDDDSFLKFFHQHEEGAPKYYIPNLDRFKNSGSVIIVEGEADAQTLEYLGFNSVASTGIQKLDYVKDLYRFNKIYLAFDNDSDPKVRNQVQLALKKALAAIKNGNPSASIYTLKLPRHIKDVNEALASYNYGRSDFEELIRTAEEYLEGTLIRTSVFYTAKMVEFLQDTSKSQGLPTGIEGLDKALGGGERLGEIDALIAKAKSGKNSLFHQRIYNRIASGTPVGYLSRELRPATEVLPNLFSIDLGRNFWKLKEQVSSPEEFSKVVEEAAKRQRSWPLYFANGLGYISIEEIAQFIKEAKDKGVNYFYLDHFHRCMLDSEDRKEVAKFIHDLKTLVSDENVHLNLIVQPTKVGRDMEVSYTNMRGSVAIEQEVDQLWEFNRTEDTNITKLTLAGARHRLAKAGESIYFQYDPTTTRMWEVERSEEIVDTSIPSPIADYRIPNL